MLRVAKIAPDKKDSPYKAFVRYVRGKVNAFDIALSLRPGSYLSHGTAARLHGILSSPTNDLFVNKEQSSKPHMERNWIRLQSITHSPAILEKPTLSIGFKASAYSY